MATRWAVDESGKRKQFRSAVNEETGEEKWFPVEGAKETSKSTWGGRFISGLRDPIIGGAQLFNNAMKNNPKFPYAHKGMELIDSFLHDKTGGILGYPGGNINKAIQQREQAYQQQLPKDEGFDEARFLGNLTTAMAGTKGVPAPKGFMGAAGQGAAMAGGLSALAPITDSDYNSRKLKDVALSTGIGAALGPVGYGIGRIISPKFKNKAVVESMKKEGIDPTIGQAMGGVIDKMEQKAVSVPFMGDAISGARKQAQKQFNVAKINQAIAPIGKKVTGSGFNAVDDAATQVSKAYDDAIASAPGIVMDKASRGQMSQLMGMSKNMSDPNIAQFNRILKNEVIRRLSPKQGMTSRTYKEMDAELGKQIGKAKNNQELQDALKEVKRIFTDQAKRTDPKFAQKIANADLAFKQMEGIKNASGTAKINDGVFTPGQLISGIRQADLSKRKGLFKRGKAPMQQDAIKAQQVLGNTVPNSGTFDRLAATGGLLGAGWYDPVTTMLALGGGSLLYTKPMQKALIAAATKRPASAGLTSEVISKSLPLLSPALITGE